MIRYTCRALKAAALLFIAAAMCSAQPARVRVACIGNSITWGGLGDFSYPQQLQKKLGTAFDVRNFGVSGRALLKKSDFPYWKEPEFTDARNFDPHIVIIKLGTNDSKPQNWIYKDEFFGDFMDMVAAFRVQGRRPQIYVCFPVPVFRTNWGINEPIVKNEIIPLIDSVRKSAHTFLIDFYTAMKNDGALFPDGVHPNAVGYEKMAQLACDTIMHGQSGVIRYFYAQHDTLNKNETTTLYWNTSENSRVFLDGNPVGRIDSLHIAPVSTHTYTLTTLGATTDSISRTIAYYPPGRIKSFRSNIPYYEIGSTDSIALSWQTGSGSVVTLNGKPVQENDTCSVSVSRDTVFTLAASGDISDAQRIHITGIESAKINRALHRTVDASSTDWGFSAGSLNDGNDTTFWKSKSGKTQWVWIDFGKTISIRRMRLLWGPVCGTSYFCYVFKETGESEEIFSTFEGDGGEDVLAGLSGTGRYLRILLLKNNSADAPYLLKECEVYSAAGVTSVPDRSSRPLPAAFLLEQNFPNPFNPATTIGYTIPVIDENLSGRKVILEVYDVLGKKVAAVDTEVKEPGKYSVGFNGSHLPSGVYYARMQYGGAIQTRVMLLLK